MHHLLWLLDAEREKTKLKRVLPCFLLKSNKKERRNVVDFLEDEGFRMGLANLCASQPKSVSH